MWLRRRLRFLQNTYKRHGFPISREEFRILWPILGMILLGSYIWRSVTAPREASAAEAYGDWDTPEGDSITAGRVASILGPYYRGNVSTARRRWLMRASSGKLVSDYSYDLDPMPALFEGIEKDSSHVAQHMRAWESLSSSIDPNGPKIVVATTSSDSLSTIRNWIGYHMSLGVSRFYVFLDGPLANKEAVQRLSTWLPKEHVTLIPRTLDFRDKEAKSRIWKEHWLSPFFNKPCNSDLFVKQTLNLEVAVKMAAKDKMDWIMHIDTDELLFPGAEYNNSMQDLLAAVDPQWKYVEFANYEALPEKENVVDPFAEVSLLKRSHLHLSADLYKKANSQVSDKTRVSYTFAYSNGKSAARVREGLRPNGAHKFSNYKFPLDKERMKKDYLVPHESAYLVHYVYSRFQDLASRRDRCDCLPTKEDVPRCFMLSFDRAAFIAASTLSEADLREWYRSRVVWSDPSMVDQLMDEGVLLRERFFSQRMSWVENVFEENT